MPTFRPALALRDRTRTHASARNAHCFTAFTDLDLDAPGRQTGFLHIPHSPHEDAWGAVRIPMAVLSNGEGPTVVLEGGNHGDEYEGQIVLGELIRDLPLEHVRGRLIFMPSMNTPAALAGRRTSPHDGKNLNRCFPGDHAGTITEQIAAYVNDALFARADGFLSLHSGGSSLDILPSALVQSCDDPTLTQRNQEAAFVFGAPLNVQLDLLGDTRTSMACATAAGITTMATEMAGKGTVTATALDICRRGTRRVLVHWGVLDESHAPDAAPTPAPFFKVGGAKAYVLAPDRGVFEPYHQHGDRVEAGQPAGRIHQTFDPQRPPVEIHYGASGVVFTKRHPSLVEPGNVCYVIASPM